MSFVRVTEDHDGQERSVLLNVDNVLLMRPVVEGTEIRLMDSSLLVVRETVEELGKRL